MMNTMLKTTCFLLLCFFFGSRFVGALDVDEFQKRVREWLNLRRESAQVKSEWERQQALLLDEMRMLEQQKEHLLQVVEAGRMKVEDLKAAHDEEQRGKQTYTHALERLHPYLLQAEKQLKFWQARLPVFMLQPLLETFKMLPKPVEPETPSLLAKRMQTIIALYRQLEQLNCSIHAEKVILHDPEGKEREMDVIFLGLAIGFAVSSDDTRAAIGHVTGKGVVWKWDPALARSIRHAWACYRKEQPAEFVNLPLEIEIEEPVQ